MKILETLIHRGAFVLLGVFAFGVGYISGIIRAPEQTADISNPSENRIVLIYISPTSSFAPAHAVPEKSGSPEGAERLMLTAQPESIPECLKVGAQSPAMPLESFDRSVGRY
jgi:hypothetical protein